MCGLGGQLRIRVSKRIGGVFRWPSWYIYLEGSYHGSDAAPGKINRDEDSSGGRNKKKNGENSLVH